MDFDAFMRNVDLVCTISENDRASLANATLTTSKKFEGKRYKDVLKNQVDYTAEIKQVEAARKRLAVEERKKNKERSDISELESELKELDKKFSHLEVKLEKLREDCKDLAARSSMSSSDASILNTLKKKFTLYKEISGLKWDFTCPEEEIVGYVRNKRAGTTQYFNLTGRPKECVWDLLNDASHADWSGIGEAEDKENFAKGSGNE